MNELGRVSQESLTKHANVMRLVSQETFTKTLLSPNKPKTIHGEIYMITPVRKLSSKLLLSMFLVVSLFSLIISNVVASSSATAWEKLYGGAFDDEAAAIVQTSDGGYVIAGTTRSFGAGGADFWLFKIDEDGNVAWNRTYGGSQYDFVQAMVATSDGGYAMVGETHSFGVGERDCWLIKVDSSGNMQWNRTYGEPTSD